MPNELISRVFIADGFLHLVLASGGHDHYQYIYREAMSVYWDPQRKSFKCSTSIPGLPLDRLLLHIVQIVSGFGIKLGFSQFPALFDLRDEEMEVIQSQVKQLTTGCS